MKNDGLVSIIIPVYNTNPFLMRKCFESVKKQTYPNLEILVINDGSTNQKTNDFLANLSIKNIHIIKTTNNGVSAARNRGLMEAKGEYVFFLDADDYMDADTIEILYKTIQEKHTVSVFAKKIRITNGKEVPVSKNNNIEINLEKDFDNIVLNTYNFASQGVLIKATVAKKIEFDECIKYGEDFQYMFKILASGQSFYTDKCTYKYVEHNHSTLRSCDYTSAEKYLSDFYDIYSEILQQHPDKKDILSLMMCEKINTILKRLYVGHGVDAKAYKKLAKEYRKYKFSEKMPKLVSRPSQRVYTMLYYHNAFLLHYLLTVLLCAIGGYK